MQFDTPSMVLADSIEGNTNNGGPKSVGCRSVSQLRTLAAAEEAMKSQHQSKGSCTRKILPEFGAITKELAAPMSFPGLSVMRRLEALSR